MSPGSTRKKPVCQKCGHHMAGHKRPNGAPVCPRDGPAPFVRTSAQAPSNLQFNPTPSGYWHRVNPHWKDPANDNHPRDNPPERRPSAQSWVTTEPDDGTPSRPRHTRCSPPAVEVIDVDAEEVYDSQETTYVSKKYAKGGSPGREYEYEPDYDDGFDYTRQQSQLFDEEEEDDEGSAVDEMSDTSSNASSTVSLLRRMTRHFSQAIGRSTPVASLYASPFEQVAAIATAAEAEGLYTRVRHVDRGPVKQEPITPPRPLVAREHSWYVAVGRDPAAVNALVNSPTSKSAMHPIAESEVVLEPYDYTRGLSSELNERVGTYPVDPSQIRNTFLDVILAGAVGGLVVFYCLSSI